METKPGYKTTEFWLTVAASLIGLLFASGVIPTDSSIDKLLGGAAMALSAIGYSVSRGIAKRNPPAAPGTGGTGIGLLLCGILASGMLVGCKTPERTAYISIGTTATLVDAAMNGWGDYVRAGKATDGDQAAVRLAYERYQGAMKVAKAVQLSLKESQASSDPVWLKVVEATSAASGDLINLVASFVPSIKPLKP